MRLGLIPAHAGKTSYARSWQSRERAHPRSRGENPASVYLVCLLVGSSPLTRGKQPMRFGKQDIIGLIPAHAGKTR